MDAPKIVNGKPIYGIFHSRPNRFVVKSYVSGMGLVEAFLPNPGRLRELLLPDSKLLLEKSNKSFNRKTEYTVCGVYKNEYLVGLNTLRTNDIAEYLLRERLVDQLESLQIQRKEVTYNGSRFDFEVLLNGRKTFLEVKSVTLTGNKIAMFPDAVTERGKRHLKELQAFSKLENIETFVLFIVQGSEVDYFMPDFHTDLGFAVTMMNVQQNVKFIPVHVHWNSNMTVSQSTKTLDIPWDYVEMMSKDRGAYVLGFDIERDVSVNVGALGEHFFPKGSYMYVGSAMNGLSARIARHKRRIKNKRWHIDYLMSIASNVVHMPVISAVNIEVPLAKALSEVYIPYAKGFGASDSCMDTHLFSAPPDATNSAEFQDIILSFRLRYANDIY